jgi:type I restriction enzyme S subunit
VVKTIEATEDEVERYKLLPNDLLLTEGGDPDKLGRGTLWNGELPECIHQNHIFRVRITSPEVHPLFLNWLVGSQRGKRYFLRSAKQTTGIASINMTQLRSFPMIFPPLAIQLDFARRISVAEKLKNTYRTSLAKLEALFASLQQRAFEGEL